MHSVGLPDAPSGDCRHCPCPGESHMHRLSGRYEPRATDVIFRQVPTLMRRLQTRPCLGCSACPGFDQEDT